MSVVQLLDKENKNLKEKKKRIVVYSKRIQLYHRKSWGTWCYLFFRNGGK